MYFFGLITKYLTQFDQKLRDWLWMKPENWVQFLKSIKYTVLKMSFWSSRASWEYVSRLWLRGSDQVGLCCGVLQRSRHLHSHRTEAWRHVLLPGSRHRLLSGQFVVLSSVQSGCVRMCLCVLLNATRFFCGPCRTLMWILKRWTERPRKRRGFTFCPRVCHSTAFTPESAHCRSSR